jgi:hypothetical protein
VDKEPLNPPVWASVGEVENKHLSDLLSLASANFGRHTDWFFRHRETGLRNLAAILAAESALVGVALTQKGIPAAFIVVLLMALACAAPAVAWLAVSSCRRNFVAALENLFMIAKVAWAMGIMANVAVNEKVVGAAPCPGRGDKTLYAPRWARDTLAHTTCEGFVAANLDNPRNTVFMAKLTIIIFGVGACALGLLGAGIVLLHQT